MDSKRISALNERLINIKNKIKDINGLLKRYKNSIDEMSNNMELVKIQLGQSEHPKRVKMNKIMDEVKQKIKVRDKEQRDKLKSLGEFFNRKEKNIKTFIKPTSTYKAVNFVNVGGLKSRIFDFIAVVNRNSELVEKELSSLQIELSEVSTKYPGIKGDWLEALLKPDALIGTAKPDALIEMTAALEPSQEMTSSVEALVETQHKPLVFVAKHSCFGKTAWCGITH
ncbi:hypothetical protein [Providencia rettgeri]|uniref:hypothetical protein n=1 Tax=Providencia rettgeri TaxID=587 RepID=UPI0005B45897